MVWEEQIMRQFSSGATRNNEEGKHDYEGFLSPLVIERFGDYMTSHRKQADGKLRDSDNWQKGFGDKHLDVCIKSLWRHFLDMLLWHRGYKKKCREDIENTCCAVLFNVMAYLHWILKDKQNE